MKTLIIFSLSSTYRPRSVITSLAVDEKANGHDVTVLDISDFSYVNQDLPPRWFARLFGQDVYPNSLGKVFEDNGIPMTKLERSHNREDLKLPPDVEAELADAVHSELVTYVHSDKPNLEKWFTSYSAKKIREAAVPIFSALSDFLATNRFERVLIPNGRVPDQRLALIACRQHISQIDFYEIGRAVENSYYLGTQQVHDRAGTQAEVAEVTQHLSDEEVEKLAQNWLANRMGTGLSVHPFNKGWEELPDSAPIEDPNLAVFFSSSVDEFASYGDSWKQHSWSDQYEAFQAIITQLEAKGVQCVLRIHPNLQNKSKEYVQAEMGRISRLCREHPSLAVLSHTDSTNSYALIQKAKYVIVGRSTLGLEASCLGKSVWVTTATRYDDVADVKKIFGPEDVSAGSLQPWEVNPAGAWRFVAYWVIQDRPFRFGEDQWATWDSLSAPLMMKIGNLLIPNSIPHRFHLIRLGFRRFLNKKIGSSCSS
jgi:hypothetical protein